MSVLEVPMPVVRAGTVLVRTQYSLISAGTEGSTVRAARRSLIGKVRERPQQVRQLLDVARQQGPVQAYRTAMKKLEAYSPLGYSAVGEVLEVAAGVRGVRVGDLVACGGSTASHAEVIAVPVNLCVRLEPGDDLAKAAYNTLGAIALQGIRQADVRLGEAAAVIGLGLLGQLTCMMLRAAGVRVVGIDVDQVAVASASPRADLALGRGDAGLVERVIDFTAGLGVDAVIITAATDSTDPINLAGMLARDRGRVVLVGAAPAGFDREPYYRKELELRMSRSTGPGRYDATYEEKGVDYPAGYVRWTERRNMAAFQELIRSGRVDPAALTTHVFPLERAPEAYELVLHKREPVLGVLIRYESAAAPQRAPVVIAARKEESAIGVGFIGAGSYASGFLLPNIDAGSGVVLRSVLAASGASSRSAAERFGFAVCAASEADVIDDPETNVVFITTRHDSHASLVLRALSAGKHVFVEKPLCLRLEELAEIRARYAELASAGRAPLLMVGFNRRFAPLASRLKKWLGDGPHAILYRINAGALPADSWLADVDVGGGRIVGEGCHFIDFLSFVAGSRPTAVAGAVMNDSAGTGDTAMLTLTFADGSVGTVAYVANGSKAVPKEYVEVTSHGRTAILRDYKELELFGRKREGGAKLMSQDKGQKAMLTAFFAALRAGGLAPIAAEELFASTEATLRVVEAIASGSVIRVGETK
jgi:predicted dehydrogenase/threonine dehydrogenase-like Zn-dependent dehydrogenase